MTRAARPGSFPAHVHAWALCLLAAACGETRLAQGRPHAVVTPSAVDFGATPLLFPVRRTLKVSNPGSAPLELRGVRVEGAQAGAFSVSTLVAAVSPGDEAELTAVFAPPVSGPHAATLFLQTNDADVPEVPVPLTGQGTSAGHLGLSPAALDFGRVGEGTTVVRELSLQSAGPADLYLAGLSFAAGTPAAYALVGAANAGATLPAGSSARIAVRFSPPQGLPGGAGTLLVDSSDPAQPHAQVPLTATLNRAPVPVLRGQVGSAPPQAVALTAPVGATVLLDTSGSADPDGDLPLTLSLRLSARPEGSLAAVSASQLRLDQPGVYSLLLDAHDGTGLQALAPARLDVRAVSGEALTLQLVWDRVQPDLDLHLLQPQAQLGSSGDCGWTQPDPQWFPSGNPHFLGDALTGYGPETLEWASPAQGEFAVQVVYKSAHGGPAAVTGRVRVFSYGVLVAELAHAFAAEGEVWRAGTVSWPEARVTPTARRELLWEAAP